MSGPAPRGLWIALWATAALVLGLLAWDLFVHFPGYAYGDEGIQMSYLVKVRQGMGFPVAWAQGTLQRALLYAWLNASGWRLQALHGMGLAVLVAESILLFHLARRWAGEEAACWAVLAELLASSTWLRTRSMLSFHFLPLELLALGLLAGKVSGRRSALAWGLAAGALSLDYEGALIAVPLLYWACLRLEEEFGRQMAWSAGGGIAALLAVWLSSPRVVSNYASLRGAVSVGTDHLHWARTVAGNLGQLFTGGQPLAYLGVADWPTLPFWIWPGLGLGAWLAREKGLGRLLLWALLATLATQASLAPYGVPGHRLVAAWPALWMLAGLGMAHLRQAAGRAWPAAAVVLFVLAGLEVHGYAIHQLRNGGAVLQGSQALDQAVEAGAEMVRKDGAVLSSRFFDWRYPVVAFHLASRPLPPPKGPRAPAVVLVPAEYRLALEALHVPVQKFQLSRGQTPVFLLACEGPLAERFKQADLDLAEARPAGVEGLEAYKRICAWLAAHPKADPWVWSNLMHSAAWLCFADGGIGGQEVWALYLQRPCLDPGVASTLSRYFLARSAEVALRLSHDSQKVDPQYLPAYTAEENALKRLGRKDEAAAMHQHIRELYRQGAWYIPD